MLQYICSKLIKSKQRNENTLGKTKFFAGKKKHIQVTTWIMH